jgi:purine-nucleoside phosphorylase
MNIVEEYHQILQAAEYIKSISECCPDTAIILGSGMASIIDKSSIIQSIPYKAIPFFPTTTIEGHLGNLLIAKIGSRNVFVMQGRFHFYEGYSAKEITFPIRVLSVLTVRNLVLTNAAGGLSNEMEAGDLLSVSDHLSFNCESPLRGLNMDQFGPRFPDQTEVYDRKFIELLKESAQMKSIRMHVGVYAYMKGPQYETPAEISVLRNMGVSAVGMSTVPEAIVASHCGMRIAAISCISNLASGMTSGGLSHIEVIRAAKTAAEKMGILIESFIESIPE